MNDEQSGWSALAISLFLSKTTWIFKQYFYSGLQPVTVGRNAHIPVFLYQFNIITFCFKLYNEPSCNNIMLFN